jgi:hypothetical protein
MIKIYLYHLSIDPILAHFYKKNMISNGASYQHPDKNVVI